MAPLLAAMAEKLEAQDSNLAVVVWNLFLCHHHLEEFDAARETLQMLAWLAEADPADLPEALRGIREKVVNLTGGDLDAQAEGLAQALAAKEAEAGSEHPDTLQLKHNLGVIHMRREAWEEAEPLHNEGLASRLATHDERHPEVTNSAWHHFLCLHNLEDREGAQGVIDAHLRWLLDADPAELAGDQPQISEALSGFMRPTGQGA